MLVAVAVEKSVHICGSGTGAPGDYRLLGMTDPFICPALD